MPPKSNPSPIVNTLADGTAFVRLGNRPGQHARVDLADLQRLRAEGHNRAWFIASNGKGIDYVRTAEHASSRLLQPARLIVGARPHQVVRHVDGDHLNLTRKNLKVISRAQHLATVERRTVEATL